MKQNDDNVVEKNGDEEEKTNDAQNVLNDVERHFSQDQFAGGQS